MKSECEQKTNNILEVTGSTIKKKGQMPPLTFKPASTNPNFGSSERKSQPD
jgi:hypothetical protein